MKEIQMTFSIYTTFIDIFDLFRTTLNIPSYYDSTWDALEESLCDLSWLKDNIYIIIFNVDDIDNQELQDRLVELATNVNNCWSILKRCYIEFKREW